MSTNLILGIIFLLLSIFLIVLKKVYYSIPLKELKRRSINNDQLANSLYRVVVYGNSLGMLLWILISLCSAASFILLSKTIPIWLSLFIVAVLIYIYFSFLPAGKVNKFSFSLAKLLSPVVAWVLDHLHKVLSRCSAKLSPHYKAGHRTGLYERDDLIDLVKRQAHQADNRFTSDELNLIKRSLLFDDRQVADITVPRKKVKTLNASDTIGPILINELHENPLKLVLVKESPKGEVIGSLAFSDLNIHSTGHVRDVMNDRLFYVNENSPLSEAIKAFFSTGQSILVVISNSEEYIGIITIQAVLEQLFGHIKLNNPDDYLNRSMVANPAADNPDDETEVESVKTD